MQQFFIYSNFKTKMADFLFVYLLLRMLGIKRSRGEEFTKSPHVHSCYSIQNPPKDARFFTESVDAHAIKTALKITCIF